MHELETDVQNTGTVNDMKIVHNECTIIVEYSYLERIVDRFDLQEAKKSIELYRSIQWNL